MMVLLSFSFLNVYERISSEAPWPFLVKVLMSALGSEVSWRYEASVSTISATVEYDEAILRTVFLSVSP